MLKLLFSIIFLIPFISTQYLDINIGSNGIRIIIQNGQITCGTINCPDGTFQCTIMLNSWNNNQIQSEQNCTDYQGNLLLTGSPMVSNPNPGNEVHEYLLANTNGRTLDCTDCDGPNHHREQHHNDFDFHRRHHDFHHETDNSNYRKEHAEIEQAEHDAPHNFKILSNMINNNGAQISGQSNSGQKSQSNQQSNGNPNSHSSNKSKGQSNSQSNNHSNNHSNNQSNKQSNNQSNNQSNKKSNNQSNNQSNKKSNNQSNNQSNHQSNHQSNSKSRNQSNKQSSSKSKNQSNNQSNNNQSNKSQREHHNKNFFTNMFDAIAKTNWFGMAGF